MYQNVKRKQTTETINSQVSKFIREKKTLGLGNKTISNYEFTFYIFLKDLELTGDEPISIINKDLVLNWIEIMKSRVKVGTINTRLRIFRIFTNWLDLGFKIDLVRQSEEYQDDYSKEELNKLLNVNLSELSFRYYRSYVAIAIMTSLGTRAGTLCNLKWTDIDYVNNSIKYTKLKNGKIAVMPLSKVLKNILLKYQEEFLIDSGYTGQATIYKLQ